MQPAEALAARAKGATAGRVPSPWHSGLHGFEKKKVKSSLNPMEGHW